MADIEISYNNSTIASMDAGGTEVLETNEKFLIDDITINYTKTAGTATTPSTTITVSPTITVSSTGLITASAVASQSVTPAISTGYISSGTSGVITVSGSNTSQLSTQAAATHTPGTNDITIASGKYLTGVQTIKGDINLTAENIAAGVSIFGIEGTHEGGSQVDITDTLDSNGGMIRSIEISGEEIPSTSSVYSGAVASFSASENDRIINFDGNIVATQDLHGYNAPFAPGTQKNWFPYPFVDTTKTVTGITFTDLGDGQIKINGTNTGTTYATFELQASFPFGSTTVSFSASSKTYVYEDETLYMMGLASGIGAVYEGDTGRVYIRVTKDATINNVTVSPMMFKTTDNLTVFAPYANICPITGLTETNIFQEATYDEEATPKQTILFQSKNLFPGEFLQGYWAYANGNFSSDQYWICTPKIPCKSNTDYVTSWGNGYNTRWQGFVWYKADGTYLSTTNSQTATTNGKTFTSPENAAYMVYNIAGTTSSTAITPTSIQNFQLEEGSIATSYQGPIPSTVYGGKYHINGDGTVTLIVEWDSITLKGTELRYEAGSNNRYNIHVFSTDTMDYIRTDGTHIKSDMFKAISANFSGGSDSACYLNGKKIIGLQNIPNVTDTTTLQAWLAANQPTFIYKLLTPITYTLPSIEMLSLLTGTNNIWSSTGDVSITAGYVFSKIILNENVLMDVTQDTVTANSLLQGYTATAADGISITGNKQGVTITRIADSSGAETLSISGGTTIIEPLTIMENGTYTAPEGKAYNPVIVGGDILPNYIHHTSVTLTADSRTISFNIGTGVVTATIISNYDTSTSPDVVSVIGGTVSFSLSDGTFSPTAYQKVLVQNTNGALSYWAINSSGGQAWSYENGILTIANETGYWWIGGVTYDIFYI